MSRTTLYVGLCLLLPFVACSSDNVAEPVDGDLAQIELPEGFTIDYYYEDIPGARSMTWGANGTLFVGTRSGNVYALTDSDDDVIADDLHLLASGLNMPNGVAFRDGALYVAEVHRILRFDQIETRLKDPPTPVVVRGDLPAVSHHGWKFIAFGPDGKLYVPIGAPCNVCLETDDRFASIHRMNPDGTDFEIFASGVRNSVGFDWHPETGDMWFTDNGRDLLGDDLPPDELNRAPTAGMHFGFPFCHGGTILDPEFGNGRSCAEFTAPAQTLGAHVAALGTRFYNHTQFPAGYRGQMFIAEHGSWNRSSKVGYQISLVRLSGNEVTSYEPFATGWLKNEQAWGRPVDVIVHADGSLLISDDFSGAIYRIRYGKGDDSNVPPGMGR